jgi:hypothetical protein
MIKRRGSNASQHPSPKKQSGSGMANESSVVPVDDGAAIVVADSSSENIFAINSGDEDCASADVLAAIGAHSHDNGGADENPLLDAVVEPVLPLITSPGGNRDRFMMNCQPLRVCCDLGAVGLHSAGVRFAFQAVVFVVYPPSEKPERRHVLLIDSTGCAGLTVWGAHVPLFTFATVGSVVKFTKLGMSMHNGKKTLSMGRDTTVVFLPSAVVTDESKWWNSLDSSSFRRIIDVHDCEDDSVINVAGIVGMLSSETKRVRSDNKDLMTMRLTDRTGWIDVRSWNHSESEFKSFQEKPLLLKRLRVTSFSGTKVLELLDGNGTIVAPNFVGMRDLQQYWLE